MNKKIQNIGPNSQSGFSLIEILVATVMVLILSATSYRVLTKQGNTQRVSVLGQKQNDSLIKALDRFKEDISKIDSIWPKSGVASVYPHPGFGLQKNFYTNTYIRDEGLNDAVTFIHRDIEKSEIYSLKTKLDSSPTSLSAKVYDDWIQLNEPTIEIENGDMVLIYQPGKYVLGIVTHVQTSPLVKIKIRMTNENETQETKDNVWNRSSGFVTQTGVVPASFDWNQKNTADTSDNTIIFDKKIAKVQVVQAVTYELDWATTDHQPHSSSIATSRVSSTASSSGNAYILDKDGNRKKMLYRTSYANGVKTREPLAETNQLGFSYDILKSTYGGTNAFTGYTDGDLERDVGRENNTSIKLVNFNVDADDSNASFVTSSRILSVNMMLGSDSGDIEKSNQNFHTIHAALDPMLQGERYQSSAGVESAVTNNLKTKAKIAAGSVINEQSGKPLLLVNTSGNEVLLPVSTFEMKPDGTMGANTDGGIYVYNPNGCAVNPTSGCDPTNQSMIKFNIGANAKFFPNTITQRVLSDGSREILVGGMAMNNINGTSPTRTPGIGRIVVPANETLEGKLLSEDDSAGTCNIQGCEWHPIDVSQNPELLDTANITMDSGNPNVAYITTLTKSSGEGSQSKVFKALWNGTGFTYTELGSIAGSEEGKVVTAVSDKTLTFKNGNKYLAACTTKKMSQSCNGECVTEQALEDKSAIIDNDFAGPTPTPTNDALFGQIQLISTTPGVPSILLTEHNYRCGSLVVTNDRGLLAAGRLSVQEIPAASINAAVAGNPIPGFMYLDEVASQVNRQNIYADYYLVEPKTFANSSDTQHIGWLTGLTATQFADGKFVMVNANKYRLEAGFGVNNTSADQEYANAGISMIEFAGMSDRVVASVKTNAENFNASSVSVSYAPTASSKPGMYIPGSFWTSSQGNRTTPTPLPQLSPAMDDSSWFSMYQALITPNQAPGLDAGMPVFGSHMQQVADCKKSRPSSCM